MTAFLLRSFVSALTVALVLFALIVQRNIALGEGELRESDRAFDAGRLDLAVQHARAAAAAYVPGAEHVTLAYARLRAVARGAERARDAELSTFAWRAMRAAALESRHLWQPRSDELAEADREVARLSSARVPLELRRALGLPLPVLGGLLLGAGCAMFGLLGLCARSASEAPGSHAARTQGSSVRFAAWLCAMGVAFWSLALLHA